MSYPFLHDAVLSLTGLNLPLPLPMFGLMVATAMVAGTQVFKREVARLHGLGKIGLARIAGEHNASANNPGPAQVPPQNVVGDLAMLVFLAGVVGSRLFHILEHTYQWRTDPWGMVFTRSGLSIYGGLIFGTLTALWYLRRRQLPGLPMLDAAAPAMMLGYAIGRVGCQISGDGDWGVAANMALKPAWLPTWCWAQTYTGNIVGELIALPGVYPAPLYETCMALACFAVLWALRKRAWPAGGLFSLYLVLAGVERLLIEQIRLNPVLSLGGLHATQAQWISAAFALLGLLGLGLCARSVGSGAASQITVIELPK